MQYITSIPIYIFAFIFSLSIIYQDLKDILLIIKFFEKQIN